MRLFIAAGIALVATTALAFAQDDIMATRYGNTVIAKASASAPEVHLYYKADHSFSGIVVGMSFKLQGTWEIKGNQVCSTYDPAPPGINNPVCAQLDAHKVGDVWTAGDRTVTLVEGIQ